MEIFERSLEESIETFKKLLNENRMTRFRTEYLALHNYEQSKIFANLEKEDREKIYQYLSPSELADVFDLLESQDETIDVYFDEMSHPYAATVLGEMYADNAVDVLNNLKDRDRVNIYMNLMPAENAREISSLINYLDETAGAIMTTEFISVQEESTLGAAYHRLREQAIKAETIYYVYVVDENNRLVGVISLRDLIINDEDNNKDQINNDNQKEAENSKLPNTSTSTYNLIAFGLIILFAGVALYLFNRRKKSI